MFSKQYIQDKIRQSSRHKVKSSQSKNNVKTHKGDTDKRLQCSDLKTKMNSNMADKNESWGILLARMCCLSFCRD